MTTPMPEIRDRRANSAGESGRMYEAVVIGGGIAGITQLHLLQQAGINAHLLEAGSGIGGAWYWNRYPGARFDSETHTYAFLSDEELFQEWEWTEHFAAQPDIERYLNYAVDRFGLRDRIQVNTRVMEAVFDDKTATWTVITEDGESLSTRFLITAVGPLSHPIFPKVPGIEVFRGVSHHTGLWPDEEIDFTGKRVAVIGTGSSGVQILPHIAEVAAHVSVFQRTPNWCAPLNNRRFSEQEIADIKRLGTAGIRDATESGFGGFIHGPNMASALEVDDETRNNFFETLYNGPGLIKFLGNYWDVAVDKTANKLFSDFLAEKIRSRVNDTAVAEKLIPTDHGFGEKRPPQENGYYEIYNQENVQLVDLRSEPLERFSENGVVTTDREYHVDIIVIATGFDYMTGSFDQINFRGRDGHTLKEHWSDGPLTHLGMLVSGFPNLIIVGGPHSAFGNVPRSSEVQAKIALRMIEHTQKNGKTRIETTSELEREWTDEVYAAASETLIGNSVSSFTGANVPGKPRNFLVYAGSTLQSYRDHAERSAGSDFGRLSFS